ncbi:hypothetical protein KPL74_11010 [Bacillus sp. NP157]|nr:hypothetical protein KPL74_11010 [Bacillus sp. NP157]
MDTPRKRKPADASEHALDRLVDNAFEFLAGSLRALKKNPKRSVIEFYTAVELFLKARLLCEHWSLIVTKEPDRAQFLSGDFNSVTFDEACNRLRKVLQQGISEDAKKAFNVIRQHRNRMVHFFHSDDLENIRTKIALEQLQAWCHLNRLLTGEWATALPKTVPTRAALIERTLVDHRGYAQALFDQLQPVIKEAQANGASFVACVSCSMNAAEVTKTRDWLRSYSCRVCKGDWSELDMACPSCDTGGTLMAYEPFTCNESSCGHTVDVDELYDALDDDPSTYDNYLDAVTPANCDECQGHQTVCAFREEYLCVNCLSVFESLSACGWCGEFGTEPRKHSEWSGCEHCDGKAGHVRDD